MSSRNGGPILYFIFVHNKFRHIKVFSLVMNKNGLQKAKDKFLSEYSPKISELGGYTLSAGIGWSSENSKEPDSIEARAQ